MKIKPIKKYAYIKKILFLCFLVFLFLPGQKAAAAEATEVKIGRIDYNNLTMQIYDNSNSIVYYSTDQNTWFEVEAPYNSTTNAYTMDISWVTMSDDVTLYFKGNTVKTIAYVILPMQNKSFKVDYDKVEGEFIFNDYDDASSVEWRKATDYHWNSVSMNDASASYQNFQDAMDSFKTMGAKLYFRTPQTAGTDGSNTGSRPSREYLVTIPKRPSAPSIKVNVSKLNLNTTTAMEYYDSKTKLWIECDKTMSIEDIAPEALYQNGSHSVSLMIRMEPTSSNSYSKTANVTIPGQTAAPTVGDNTKDVAYYFQNSVLTMQFTKASSTNLYEYTIIKPNYDFNTATANWITVSSTKLMTLSKTSAPDGCEIYVRKKGTDENVSKNISLALASAASLISVNYP